MGIESVKGINRLYYPYDFHLDPQSVEAKYKRIIFYKIHLQRIISYPTPL